MIKSELREAITAKGGKLRRGMTKDELVEVYNNLYPEQVQTDGKPVEEQKLLVDEEQEGFDEVKDETKEATDPDAFDELLGKIETAEPPKDGASKKEKPLFETTRQRKKRGKSSPDSMQIEGYILLLVIDTIYPASFSVINNMLDKKLKIQAHQLSLKPEQWKALEPLADQAAAYLSININPVAGFLLMSTFMYGNNLINVRMEVSTK